ncbi:MAG: hypothetical protein ACP5KS_12980, partial [Candidatus Hydrogenedens sp.]
KVKIVFRPLSLKYCEGEIPVANNQSIKIKWQQDDNTIRYLISVPDDYSIEIENLTGKNLVKETN